jgi:prophage regulatory protein
MTEQFQNPSTILRRKKVEMRTGLSRSTIYARVAAGTFPHPINLGGGRAVGWVESEIDQWVEGRISASRKNIEES